MQIDKLRKIIAENEKKISILDKALGEKEQAILNLEANLEKMTHVK